MFATGLHAQSITDWDHSILNPKVSELNWENTDANWENSPLNWKNDPNNIESNRAIYDANGNRIGYKVTNKYGVVNYFNYDGKREGYAR
jgi:hypothetical protein